MNDFVLSKSLLIIFMGLLAAWLWPSPFAGVPVLVIVIALILKLKSISDDLKRW